MLFRTLAFATILMGASSEIAVPQPSAVAVSSSSSGTSSSKEDVLGTLLEQLPTPEDKEVPGLAETAWDKMAHKEYLAGLVPLLLVLIWVAKKLKKKEEK